MIAKWLKGADRGCPRGDLARSWITMIAKEKPAIMAGFCD